MHKSGFVNIIGRPNVGKSTLMNALVGERMSIITNKPQTTRHRIFGILSGDDFQIVFSDTPGVIRNPAYKMHEVMNSFVNSTFEDADIMLFVTDPTEKYDADDPIITKLKQVEVPLYLIINKIDTSSQDKITELITQWNHLVPFSKSIAISALHKEGTEGLLQVILNDLPEGPEYFPKDQLTDRTERFFVTEIIREKILEQYEEEIPYSVEVGIESYQETQTTKGEPLARIYAIIYVTRKSHQAIIIGKNGEAIKRLGTEARKDIEKFIDSKAFLELTVKVRENWRDDEQALRRFGYEG
ncbi:MAG: GTPase Era [Saprospiraceae bacterium]